jgi:mRNA-degrading endonuclease RelE of RelBE toxin-antitoxin system
MNRTSRFPSMSYSLEFKESALKEWKKLDGAIREQFKKKLADRLVRPRNLAVYRSAGERLKE